eukprot:TRINITY_DN24_c0_g1_i3.p1 TRINITY_DN24_c0_g1~~TRINITY_DN24_c0_g1_i3.p1  ORF type:complete len:1834 (+),score=563.10 TRINITY_DN24_c0_g1_i3:118-5619(+)
MAPPGRRGAAAALGILTALQGCSGGEADCNPSREECLWYFDDGRFGDAYDKISRGEADLPAAHAAIKGDLRLHSAICKHENWKRLETCYADCPMQLEISHPPQLRMRVCVEDNQFTPDQPEQHLDSQHPVNGRELEFIAVGAPGESNRMGCNAADFLDGKDYRGKMVFIKRGSCYFYQKFLHAVRHNAAAAVLVNSMGFNSIREQLYVMEGPSHGFSRLPTGLTPRQYGEIILDALDRGVEMRGKLQLSCPAGGTVPPAETEDDGCPDTRLIGLCGGRPEPRDRICASCPLHMTVAGDNRTYCIYGNMLLPRHPRNSIRTSTSFTSPNQEIAYLEGESLCDEADYAGLRGKVVIAAPSSCLTFHQMRMAELAGVAAFISLTPATQLQAGQIEGVSSMAGIPVHATLPSDAVALTGALRTGVPTPRPGGGRLWVHSGVFHPGEESTQAPTPAPSEVRVAEHTVVHLRSEFEWNTMVIALVATNFFLLCLAVAKALAAAREAPNVPAEVARGAGSKSGATHLPLHCVSTTLSLSLLTLTAGVVFVLVYNAGRASTDAAVSDSDAALDRCHQGSVDNLQALAATVRNSAVRAVAQALEETLTAGERAALIAAKLYAFYDGTWASFNSVYPLLVAQSREQRFFATVRTTQGFYADSTMKTDDRPDDVRNDGLPHVSVSNSGKHTGYILYWFDEATMRNQFWIAGPPRRQWPMDNRIASFWGDAVAMVQGKQAGFLQWHVSHYSFPSSLDSLEKFQRAFSVLTPLYGEGNRFLGVVEAMQDASQIAVWASRTVKGSQSTVMDNMTLVIYDAPTGRVLSSNKGLSYIHPDAWVTVRAEAAREALTVEQMGPPEISAFARYVRRTNGGSLVGADTSGVFDQAAEYQPQQLTVFRFDFERGIADAGEGHYKSEVHGDCAAGCVGHGHGSGWGLSLTGSSALLVFRNLSTNIPRVRQLRQRAFEPYMHTCYAFNTTCVPLDACPAGPCNCPGVPLGHCGEATVGMYNYNADRWSPGLREPFLSNPASVMMWIKPEVDVADSDMPTPATAMRLFSDTATGSANLRLFANGVLYVRIGSAYGCLTKPIPGGPPVGEWTHIAAVVDRSELRCRVFVNGRLHSEAALSGRLGAAAGEDSSMATVQPYYIGQMFRGVLDDVIALRTAATASEVRSAADTGRMRRVVEPRSWFYELAALDREDSRRAGLHWVVAAMIPRADVMRSVDANDEKLRVDLSIQKENTDRKLYQKSIEAMLIAVAIGLFSVIVFFIFNDLITRPFTVLAGAMLDVAVLKTDSFEGTTESFVTEINAMNRAMSLVCANLRMYSSFLPQTLLQTIGDAEGAGNDDSRTLAVSESTPRFDRKGSETTIRMHRAELSLALSQAPTDVSASVCLSTSDAGTSPRSSTWRRNKESVLDDPVQGYVRKLCVTENALQMALVRKVISAIAVNVNDWHHVSTHAAAQPGKLHRWVVEQLLDKVQKAKGTAEPFQGDRLWVSWNAIKYCSMHRQAATTTALHIRQAFAVPEPQSRVYLTASISLVAGDVHCGIAGTDNMRKYTFFGPIIPWSYALERYGRSLCRDLVLGDEEIYHQCKTHHCWRIASYVRLPKRHKGRPTFVYQCLSERREAVDEAEWMYQLAQAEQGDPWREHNKCWEALADGEPETALRLCQALSEIATTPSACPERIDRVSERMNASERQNAAVSEPSSQGGGKDGRVVIIDHLPPSAVGGLLRPEQCLSRSARSRDCTPRHNKELSSALHKHLHSVILQSMGADINACNPEPQDGSTDGGEDPQINNADHSSRLAAAETNSRDCSQWSTPVTVHTQANTGGFKPALSEFQAATVIRYH